MNLLQDKHGQPFPIVTFTAITWCVAVFAGVNLQADMGWPVLARWGYLPDFAVYHGSYWALITTAFVHVAPLHLFFNMYWLWIIGGAFERTLGSVALFIFMMTSAFVSSGLQFATGDLGIGMSGVGYALFGFAWISRGRYPEFARIATQSTVQTFIFWFFLCIVATYGHLMNIANMAHLAGLAFGTAVAGMLIHPSRRIVLGLAVTVLSAASVVPIFWNPMNGIWVVEQANAAAEARNYDKAIPLYRRSLQLGGVNPAYVYEALAQIYQEQKKPTEADAALNELRKIEPRAADAVRSSGN